MSESGATTDGGETHTRSYLESARSTFTDIWNTTRLHLLVATLHETTADDDKLCLDSYWDSGIKVAAGVALAAATSTAYSLASSYLPSYLTDTVASAASQMSEYVPSFLSTAISYAPSLTTVGALGAGLAIGRVAYGLADFERGVYWAGGDRGEISADLLHRINGTGEYAGVESTEGPKENTEG